MFVAGAFGTLTAADGTTGTILWSKPISGSPRGVAYSSATKLAYVTTFDGVLTVFDADPASATYQSIIRTQTVGSAGGTSFEGPELEGGRDGGDVPSVAVDLARGKVLVTHPRDRAVTIINDAR